ncbi:MAG: S8 family peptidase, partial [Bacteroides sp.]|nr:S8 family peptidase [Bacteroides sp.]
LFRSLWHLGDRQLMNNKIETYKNYINELGGRVTDDCLGNSFCLLRVNCNGTILKKLLEEDNVCEIDLIPEKIIELYSLIRKEAKDFNIGSKPPEDAPKICIIDSGISYGHPLLENAAIDTKAFGHGLIDGIDENGHGTLVASIALYDDIEECLKANEFIPRFNLYGARVLNKNCEFPKEKLIENQITEAITYYHKIGCRIFNLSIGIESDIYNGGKQFTLAQRIDEMCRDYDIFVSISIGNFRDLPYSDRKKWEETINQYPYYLLESNSKLINPATAANALTVGSLAGESKITVREERGVQLIPIAKYNQPSPFSRTGFGVNNSIKPEVCGYGGNWVINAYTQDITSPLGVGIIGCNSKFHEENILFTSDVGTSFATPQITHLAAEILLKYKRMSANSIRALIVNSCNSVGETVSLIEQVKNEMVEAVYEKIKSQKLVSKCPELVKTERGIKFNEDVRKKLMENSFINDQIKELVSKIPDKNTYLKFSGYGKPDLQRALYSNEKKVTLIAQDEIEIDHFKIFEVYVPGEIAELKGKKIITTTLAFSPLTRHTRKEYLGYDMSFKLIRGMSLENIIDVFRKREKGEDVSPKLGSKDCSLSLGTNLLKNSTVKSSSYEFSSPKFYKNYGEVLYLVVFNESKWVDDTYGKEPYSVVVTIEYVGDEIEVGLYTKINQHIKEKLNEVKEKEKVRSNVIKIRS